MPEQTGDTFGIAAETLPSHNVIPNVELKGHPKGQTTCKAFAYCSGQGGHIPIRQHYSIWQSLCAGWENDSWG